MAISEIVTNAVLHGREPITLRLLVTGTGVRIEVHHELDGSLDVRKHRGDVLTLPVRDTARLHRGAFGQDAYREMIRRIGTG